MLFLRHFPPRGTTASFLVQKFSLALALIGRHGQAGLVAFLNLLRQKSHDLTVLNEKLQNCSVLFQLDRVDINLMSFLAFELSLLAGQQIGAGNAMLD